MHAKPHLTLVKRKMMGSMGRDGKRGEAGLSKNMQQHVLKKPIAVEKGTKRKEEETWWECWALSRREYWYKAVSKEPKWTSAGSVPNFEDGVEGLTGLGCKSGWVMKRTVVVPRPRVCYPAPGPHEEYFISGAFAATHGKGATHRFSIFWPVEDVRMAMKQRRCAMEYPPMENPRIDEMRLLGGEISQSVRGLQEAGKVSLFTQEQQASPLPMIYSKRGNGQLSFPSPSGYSVYGILSNSEVEDDVCTKGLGGSIYVFRPFSRLDLGYSYA
ncbi:hypothetical protein G7Y89_g13165 [Cudoniella acicularis]|uniref:Uncharacterized protein n=1 Tax=Cudoniella acicularis TaxID=354080 RepID=A0A8H4VYZ0_9HELO|nr:hypothetical protein G7Y89_g13165 [Cudoniella acicularis]